tara:strand:- start:650 stop:1387 length:738 start_codon:yes stop_codon:yes gene_type:complete
MKLILPMAGNGQRFFDDGYDLPKPLIDIKGKPMFVRVIENLWLGDDIKPWCIVRQDHVSEYEIDKRILEHYPDAHIIIIPGTTEGAACTVRLATNVLGGEPMMVANCDQLMLWDPKEFYEKIETNLHPGGLIPVFQPNHNEPKHSYVDVNAYDELLVLKEKEIISNLATVGVYYFGDESKWIKAHEEQMKQNDRTNNEFYLAPTYNYIKESVGIFRVDKMIGMGTPEELNEFKNSEWWDKLDEAF